MRTALLAAVVLACLSAAVLAQRQPGTGAPGAFPPGLGPQGGRPAVGQFPGTRLPGTEPIVAQPTAGNLPSLAGVQWAGQPLSFDQLAGKTVVLLVYASWCPKCNAWSGGLFAQLKAAIRSKPVVILAIYADESPRAALPYLQQRGFFAPNIVHGYDPSMPAKLGFQSNLYHYAMIGPDGRLRATGSAGSFFKTREGNKFALPVKLAASENLGELKFITPEMSEEVQAIFWPCELGEISERELQAGRRKLSAEQQKEVDAAVDRYLTGQIQRIRELYKGTVPERVEAYQIADRLSGMFRSTAQSTKAREVLEYLRNDSELKRELAAKKLYDSILEGAADNPTRRRILLRSVKTRFKDTHYGRLAAAALEGDPGQ